MSIEYLNLTKDGVRNYYANGGLADKPVASCDVDRRAI
jgi:hypothetical protein